VDAVRWYRAAGEQGSVSALTRLGEIYLTGMAAPDTATKAALEQMGESAGQQSLLKRLYPGDLPSPRTSSRPPVGVRARRTPAMRGAGAPRYQYASGLGLARDLSQAEFWFDAAATQDHPAGQLGLGMLYAGSYGEVVSTSGRCSG